MIRIEPTVIEASIGIANRDCKRRSGSVRPVVIDEIQVVRPEVHITERRVGWNGVSSRTTAGRTRIEGGCYCEGRRVCVIDVGRDTAASRIAPNNVDDILALIIRVPGLAEQVDRTRTGYIDLLGVVSREDEDVRSGCIVGQT